MAFVCTPLIILLLYYCPGVTCMAVVGNIPGYLVNYLYLITVILLYHKSGNLKPLMFQLCILFLTCGSTLLICGGVILMLQAVFTASLLPMLSIAVAVSVHTIRWVGLIVSYHVT